MNSVFAKDVGEAWIAADPQNADPYALLGAHYAALDDESGIEKLLQNAETNGVDFNTIDAKIKTNSDGTCTLTVQINDFLKDESGQSASVSVKVDAKDNAKTVTQRWPRKQRTAQQARSWKKRTHRRSGRHRKFDGSGGSPKRPRQRGKRTGNRIVRDSDGAYL